MKKTKIAAVALASLMSVSAMAGCTKTPAATTAGTAGTGGETTAAPAQVKEFSAFFAVPATTEINKDNEIQKIITEKIGAKCNETWLAGQQASEAVGVFIASGEYPDFINGGDAMKALYEAGALIAWDDYIDKYPNIKEFFSDYEWSQFRQSDG
ncbi:MAG: sugar ABC transporter substrate-binding protein, partial [Clostridiales bacterium]|nr:sugar ABC transporter substrate-binding protein [Clostridiales bacterium]